MKQEFSVKDLCTLIGKRMSVTNLLTDSTEDGGVIQDVSIIATENYQMIELSVCVSNSNSYFRLLPIECKAFLSSYPRFMRIVGNTPVVYQLDNENTDSNNE